MEMEKTWIYHVVLGWNLSYICELMVFSMCVCACAHVHVCDHADSNMTFWKQIQNLPFSCVCQKRRKWSKNNGDLLKGHQSQIEGDLMDQIWSNLRININNKSNYDLLNKIANKCKMM